MLNTDITIIIVAYNPKVELLEKIIETFHIDYSIIITNNSERKLDGKFYSYNNVEIIDSLKNKGNGAGINTCLSFCKTKLALYLDIDAQIDRENLQKLLYYSKKLKSYGVLIPNNQKDIPSDKCKKKIFKRWDVEGSVILFNLENLKNQILFDEKIFLYFEENDFFHQCFKSNKKIYMIENLSSDHLDGSVDDKSFKFECFKKWHWEWSKYYFLSKHYNKYLILALALKDLLKFLIKALLLYFFNKKKFKIYLSKIKGLTGFYLKKKLNTF